MLVVSKTCVNIFHLSYTISILNVQLQPAVGDKLMKMKCVFILLSVEAEDVKRLGSAINILSSEKLKAQKVSHISDNRKR